MVCAGLNSTLNEGISGILAYPTTCDYYFYSKIMVAIWIILTFILYHKEKDDNIPNPDMISCMAISSIAVIFIALTGSLLGIIQPEIFIEILVMGMVFVAIWYFKR